jgi:hypothetical protein
VRGWIRSFAISLFLVREEPHQAAAVRRYATRDSDAWKTLGCPVDYCTALGFPATMMLKTGGAGYRVR